MTSKVLKELHTLPRFRFELQLDKLFDRFQASVRGVISRIYIEFIALACLVDGQGLDLRPLVHAHDLSAFRRYGGEAWKAP